MANFGAPTRQLLRARTKPIDCLPLPLEGIDDIQSRDLPSLVPAALRSVPGAQSSVYSGELAELS